MGYLAQPGCVREPISLGAPEDRASALAWQARGPGFGPGDKKLSEGEGYSLQSRNWTDNLDWTDRETGSERVLQLDDGEP